MNKGLLVLLFVLIYKSFARFDIQRSERLGLQPRNLLKKSSVTKERQDASLSHETVAEDFSDFVVEKPLESVLYIKHLLKKNLKWIRNIGGIMMEIDCLEVLK